MKKAAFRVECDAPGCTVAPIEGDLASFDEYAPTPAGWIGFTVQANDVSREGIACSADHFAAALASVASDAVTQGANQSPPA